MYYVYVLESEQDKKLYFGYTNDLRRRLSEHNNGEVPSTEPRRPFSLRYYEAYYTEDDARNRENRLKKDGRALAQLKKRLKNSLQ